MADRFDPKLIGSITFLPDADGEWVKASDYDALAAELARVKAESLRVVKVREPVTAGDHCRDSEGKFLWDGQVLERFMSYQSQYDRKVVNVLNMDNKDFVIDARDIVQPVRLERWEAEV